MLIPYDERNMIALLFLYLKGLADVGIRLFHTFFPTSVSKATCTVSVNDNT